MMQLSPSVQVVVDPRGVDDLCEHLATVDGIEVVAATTRTQVTKALAAGASVLISFDWDPDYLQPSLAWVQGRGIGFDRFPLAELAARDVVLTTGAGLHHGAVAEHAFAMLLAMFRGIPRSVRAGIPHVWDVEVGHELAGSRIAILGLGAIGSSFARRCAGWDVRLIGVTRDPARHRDGPVTDVRPLAGLLGACAEADVLVIAAPAPADGVPIVRAEHLAALGTGWLVNVGRGGVVDETALLGCLVGGGPHGSGALRGAALDVFDTEPLPASSPWWDLPNVLITPHKAGSTVHYGRRFLALFESNLKAFHQRGQWSNLVVDGQIVRPWTTDGP